MSETLERAAAGKHAPTRAAGVLAAAWGVGGFALLLLFAIARLGAVMQSACCDSWQALHWLALLASVVGMAYFEGYRAFQLAYAPRFAARAAFLLRAPTLLRVLFAPLFCMSFFHAPRQRVVRAVVLTTAIVLLVLAVRLLPQPWRGIIDAGVVAGLAWGLVVTALAVYRALSGSTAFDDEFA